MYQSHGLLAIAKLLVFCLESGNPDFVVIYAMTNIVGEEDDVELEEVENGENNTAQVMFK